MRQIQIQLSPEIALNEQELENHLRKTYFKSQTDAFYFEVKKQSLDARQKKVRVNLDINISEKPFEDSPEYAFDHSIKKFTKKLIIVGSGPAGLFAALRSIELGVKPIVFERGSDVRLRRRDLAAINKEHRVNPESNYCYGEGGAGTYSDGKLYTRSKKRGDINRILEILVKYGATPKIKVDAHPHIGTNKLPQVVSALREAIIAGGGEVFFNTKVADLIIQKNEIKGVVANDEEHLADAVLLATGHSARDIFNLLAEKKVLIEAKPFAMGVRIEHEQSFIDQCQYGTSERGLLPAAAYSLVSQTVSKGQQRGVFSFCMCPGGFIVPSATAEGELVVNGMSPSRRDSRFANSGVVVSVNEPDWKHFSKSGPLAALHFQMEVEQKAHELLANHLSVSSTQTMPAQKIQDFGKGKVSAALNPTSYQPGLCSFDFREILPKFIVECENSA
jgi:uncharacterized protein